MKIPFQTNCFKLQSKTTLIIQMKQKLLIFFFIISSLWQFSFERKSFLPLETKIIVIILHNIKVMPKKWKKKLIKIKKIVVRTKYE